jgi:hypothetical protein
MSEVQTINIDDLSEGGGRVPAGRYRARLMQSEGKTSKKGNPMLEVAWLILEGDFEGSECKQWFPLVVSEAKNGSGKKYSGGIMDMKRTFSAVEKPLPSGFKFPLDANTANQLFAKRLKGVEVELALIDEKPNEDGKVFTRTQVIGMWNKKPVAVGTAEEHFDFGED